MENKSVISQQVLFTCEGPSLNVCTSDLNFGFVRIKSEMSRVITLKNDSDIDTEVYIKLKNDDSFNWNYHYEEDNESQSWKQHWHSVHQ